MRDGNPQPAIGLCDVAGELRDEFMRCLRYAGNGVALALKTAGNLQCTFEGIEPDCVCDLIRTSGVR